MSEVDVHGNPARRITALARLLTRYFDRRLAPLGISVANLPVLGALRATSSMSQRELTEIGGIGQPAMAQMLDRLLREGMLVRTADTIDRRKALFSLSKRGKELMTDLEARLEAGNAEAFSIFSQPEFEELMALAQKLETHLAAKIDQDR
jgi:DNA-binding MarR family transcriptional regulator